MSKTATGGNIFTMYFGHCADAFISVLRKSADVSAMLSIQWPLVRSLKSDGLFDRMINRETPDHVLFHGTLVTTSTPVSNTARGGKPYKGALPLIWHIFGADGKSPRHGPSLHFS